MQTCKDKNMIKFCEVVTRRMVHLIFETKIFNFTTHDFLRNKYVNKCVYNNVKPLSHSYW